jgi:hypothetical protein
MIIDTKNMKFELEFEYEKENAWIKYDPVEADAFEGIRFSDHEKQGKYSFALELEKDRIGYEMSFDCQYDTAMRLRLKPVGNAGDIYHVIPCNIFGNNNEPFVKPGELPLLTEANSEYTYCSSKIWFIL